MILDNFFLCCENLGADLLGRGKKISLGEIYDQSVNVTENDNYRGTMMAIMDHHQPSCTGVNLAKLLHL